MAKFSAISPPAEPIGRTKTCGQCSRLQLIEQFMRQRFINTLILLHCAQETVDQDVVRTAKTLRESFQGTIYHIDVNRHDFHQQLGWHMYCERMKIILVEDWRFDLIGTNSTRGVVGQLQSKTVDFSITPFAPTTERIQLSDYTIEIDRGGFYTIFRHPKSLNQSNIFLLPFEALLWTAVVVILVCITLVLSLSSICNQRFERATYNDLIIGQSILGTLGMLCQQGFHASTTVCSRKILIIVTMGFTLLLLQFYSTFIVGYQLITPPKTINTLEKLVDSTLKMSVEDLSYQHDFFARVTIAMAKEDWET
uniref:Ionotropic glutamate receptor C-terminal domain-containing protein n=1 Tax=Anopheles atroparvus TaxID=41427 RepID=A0A182IS27_ANOAO